MADLLAFSRQDMSNFTSVGGFSVEIVFNDVTVVRGLASKHHLVIDPETGTPVNVKNAHIAVTETVLLAAGITVRNANQEIAIKDMKVSFADSSGVVKHYLIDDAMPSETLGLIVCTLGDWKV